MSTKAHFENINKEIAKHLKAAKHTIHVAVAWFTDDYLFKILTEKAEKGLFISVMIIDDDINRGASLYHKDLITAGVQLSLVSKSAEDDFMHNKFCVIDNKTVITGSYNWTFNAQFNNENIIVIENNTPLATSYIIEYYRLMKKFVSDTIPLIEYKSVLKPIELKAAMDLGITKEELDQLRM